MVLCTVFSFPLEQLHCTTLLCSCQQLIEVFLTSLLVQLNQLVID
uniref:Uncharacterized protein n=1 Tax=Siphoviridae sp. ctRuT6 TaxID=2826339 RepID=A0A8S5N2J7_9CAUD|nr:MAG TPA: hypothetical protein [Siphoviridae sp. ctRuT6]